MSVRAEDVAMARRCAIEGKRLAAQLASNWVARMDPKAISWDKSAELARMVRDLAYHVNWLGNAVVVDEGGGKPEGGEP